MNRKMLFPAIIIGGTDGLATGPSWSQDGPRGSRQANPEQSSPGASENVPATRGAAQELSTNDMKLGQQRLQERGYNPGTINGTADDTTRTATRKSQQDQRVPDTRTIEESSG